MRRHSERVQKHQERKARERRFARPAPSADADPRTQKKPERRTGRELEVMEEE